MAAPPAPTCRHVASALAAHGMILRGGFEPRPEDAVPDAAEGMPARALLLVGNAGPAMWREFSPHIDGARHPLDRWTRAVVGPLAERFGARAVFPFDDPPLPFQRWAKRAEGLASSPVGVLIHPEFGLWHAYRAALLFGCRVDEIPLPVSAPVPCDGCAAKPCLSACPVGAFTGSGYDVPACAGHLASRASRPCHDDGCRARDACPVGREYRYDSEQIRFHMTAFSRAIGGG